MKRCQVSARVPIPGEGGSLMGGVVMARRRLNDLFREKRRFPSADERARHEGPVASARNSPPWTHPG